MHVNVKIGSDKNLYIILFLIAFAVVFTSCYNPLFLRRMHVDSSVYVTVAQGITRGFLPYKDLVDNKGPLTYLITAPGFLIGGFSGIWITELFLMFLSVFYAFKTAMLFGNRLASMQGTVFTFAASLVFFYVNAGTEQYSLPFLMCSLFIFAKHFFSAEQETGFKDLIVLGFCFASAIMIKLNMFPLWAGFCFVIIIDTVFKRRFTLLAKYIFCFSLGACVSFVAVFFYLVYNGITDDFFYQVIFGGAARGFNNGGLKEIAKNYYAVINNNFSFLPLFFGIFSMIIHFKKKLFAFYSGYTLSCFLMILFLSFSSGGSHWNLVLIPFFVPVLTNIFAVLNNTFSSIKWKNTIIVLFACFVFSEGLINYFYDLTKILNEKSGSQLIKTGKTIDENTINGDKIISLGFNGYIYPFTQRNPASRYFYQGSGLDQISGANDEFIFDILTDKPAIIAIFTAEDGDGSGQFFHKWHAPIMELIENEYGLLSDENGFNLYKRKK